MKPLLVCWSLLVLLAAGSAGAMEIGGAHAGKQLGCADCHQADAPEKAPTTENCLQCHGPLEKLIEATAPKAVDPAVPESHANPHKSHLGPLDCTKCHRTHSPSVFACAECHNFDMVPK